MTRRGIATLIGGSAVVIGGAALLGIVRALISRSPLDPWESAQIVEATRLLRGMPLYESGPNAHATLIYGPLSPVVTALVIGITGPSLVAARSVSLGAAACLIALLFHAARASWTRWPGASLILLGLALSLGIDVQTMHAFALTRPDMLATALAGASLMVLHRAASRESVAWWAIGVVCMLGAVFVKQSTALASAVPLAAWCIGAHRSTRRLLMALGTPAAIGVAILSLAMIAPDVHHYMVDIPAGYALVRYEVVLGALRFLLSVPLLWIAVTLRVIAPGEPVNDDVERWAVATAVVTFGACAVMSAKLGANTNTWLPARFAVAFFILLQLARWRDLLDMVLPHRARALVLAAAIAVVSVLSTHDVRHNAAPIDRHPEWARVVQAAVALAPGRLVSPDDPLIALAARGVVGRSLVLERDAERKGGRWTSDPPSRTGLELADARWVISVESGDVATMGESVHEIASLNPALLSYLGFTRRHSIGRYGVWERTPDRGAARTPDQAVRSQTPSTLLPTR